MALMITSIVAFVSTNIDDIFLLMLFFGDRRYRTADIYIGQYLGIISLIAISVLGSLIGNVVEGKYIGLLGLFPIYLAIRQLTDLWRGTTNTGSEGSEQPFVTTGFLTVATVTMANGGDNIGTYIPLFAALTPSEKSIMIALFLLMVFVLVSLARYLTKHPALARSISKYGHIATPVVLFLLGLYILRENGSFQLVG